MDACTCDFDAVGEHPVDCPLYEPPLTQAEIRILRRGPWPPMGPNDAALAAILLFINTRLWQIPSDPLGSDDWLELLPKVQG